ncbi:TPMT [Bugula neritina]|uniref:TPMT n=1 Tax=Bugula neritina TaxID=10212 RepID=A0A7J7K6R9_BUGNE|nr:TPMT [Bugula neritina]
MFAKFRQHLQLCSTLLSLRSLTSARQSLYFTTTMNAGANPRSLDDWQQRWTEGNTKWHEPNGNEMLWRHFDKIIKDTFPTKSANELKVFIPLCGKAHDIYYFYQRGLTVVGVEYAAQPIKEFFEENNLEAKQPNEIGVFTETTDSRLCIGQGDLFTFTGSPGIAVVCQLKKDRPRYSKFISSLLSSDGVHLITVPEYSLEEYVGTPRVATKDDLVSVFDKMNVEYIDSRDGLAEGAYDSEKWKSRGLTSIFMKMYKMTHK